MKFAFLSDIHGNKAAFTAVLHCLDKKGIPRENTYVAGDLVGYGPFPEAVLDKIQTEGITSILGNYDEAVGFYLPTCGCKADTEAERLRTENSLSWTAKNTSEEYKAYLRTLEEALEIDCDGHKVYVTHGSPFSINEYIYSRDAERINDILDEIEADVIVMGHTHVPYVFKKSGTWFINPGSVGRPKDGDPRASICIMETLPLNQVTFEIVRIEYDVESTAKAIKKSGLLNEFADHLRKGRVDEV